MKYFLFILIALAYSQTAYCQEDYSFSVRGMDHFECSEFLAMKSDSVNYNQSPRSPGSRLGRLASLQLYPFVDGFQVGYIDITGKIRLEPIYDTPVQTNLIKVNGKTLPNLFFNKNVFFSDGKAYVRQGRRALGVIYDYKYSFINKAGRKLFDVGKDNYFPFHQNIAKVSSQIGGSSAKFSYVYNTTMRKKQSKKYDESLYIHDEPFFGIDDYADEGVMHLEMATDFTSDYALALYKDEYIYLHKNGRKINRTKFDDANEFKEGLACIQYKGKYGYIGTKFKFRIKNTFEKAYSFSEGLARFEEKGKTGFIDKKGKVVIEVQYDYAGDFSNGLAIIKVGLKLGYVDKTGAVIIAPKYLSAGDFKDGLAFIEKNGKWGFIDKTGKIVIPLEYDYVESFKNGLAKAWKDNQIFYINVQGKHVHILVRRSMYNKILNMNKK